MKDTIEEKDLIINSDVQNKLERELEAERNKTSIMEDRLKILQSKVEQKSKRDEFILKLLKGLMEKGKFNEILDSVHEQELYKELAELSE